VHLLIYGERAFLQAMSFTAEAVLEQLSNKEKTALLSGEFAQRLLSP
jgi:hypothetical protein